MVFVNGLFSAALSDCAALPAGVMLRDLASRGRAPPMRSSTVGRVATYDDAAFTALNAAFMHDGAVMQIAKDTVVDAPIHLLFVTDGSAVNGMMHPRNLILAGRNAKATMVESYVSSPARRTSRTR